MSWYIDTSGDLYNCGSGASGQQGSGGTTGDKTFTKRASNVESTNLNSYVSWYIDSSSNLYLTGQGTYGSQGSGATTNVTSYTQRASNVVSAGTGYGASWYIDSSADFFLTGQNSSGQQGSGDTTNVTTFTKRASNVVSAFAGNGTLFYLALPLLSVPVASNNTDYGTVDEASITAAIGDPITISNNTLIIGETTVTATPTTDTDQYDYSLTGWYNGDTKILNGSTVTEGMTITAVFERALQKYTVTLASSNTIYGNVSPSSLTVDYETAITVSGSSLTIGSQAITATASEADAQYTYAFDSWLVPGSVETVTADITITADFTATLNTYTVTIQSSDADAGTVSPTTVNDVPYGTTVTVSGNTITIGETTITATKTDDDWGLSWSIANGTEIRGDTTITAYFIEPAENALLGLLPLLLIFVLVITAAGGVFASGGNPEDLIKLIICLAVGVIIISVFVLPIAGGL